MIEVVHALSQGAPLFGETMEFGDFILLSISLFVLASGVFSIVFILWGGLLLILSGGKDEKIKPAINTIRYAIIGVIITVLSIFLFPILGRLLGIDVEKYAKPDRIFETIEEIGNKIFRSSDVKYKTTNFEDIDTPTGDFSDL
ncbi:MAG: hypothetical protein GY828_05205 [Candidatus Gracilibacteria bacterium]|nr:hypothetical protein [Candidatus Gracilibacteria bacterium]